MTLAVAVICPTLWRPECLAPMLLPAMVILLFFFACYSFSYIDPEITVLFLCMLVGEVGLNSLHGPFVFQ